MFGVPWGKRIRAETVAVPNSILPIMYDEFAPLVSGDLPPSPLASATHQEAEDPDLGELAEDVFQEVMIAHRVSIW